jgi:hypothetical protein
LSGNHAIAKNKKNLQTIIVLLEQGKIDFRNELRRFLPASQARHMKDFRKILIDKINTYIGK